MKFQCALVKEPDTNQHAKNTNVSFFYYESLSWTIIWILQYKEYLHVGITAPFNGFNVINNVWRNAMKCTDSALFI